MESEKDGPKSAWLKEEFLWQHSSYRSYRSYRSTSDGDWTIAGGDFTTCIQGQSEYLL